ncbi:conjugal transfer protein TrbE [Pelagibacterium luteolum]|uniref:Type IV secretion system protein VirB4 n=1 Tax=Pelagibacterium luteolum TaxID=440168 RepID=A0A1G7ZZ43_9HYPH|nr:conjugal transfer protein TrbE [Pelagibacterium luteolum]SDH13969.1 type IV secretion system protein VirB4 [Pelagibacterium luteolum]
MLALNHFRHREASFAELVPYAALVDDGIMLLKDGSLMAGWYYAGPDSESSTDIERNEVSRLLNTVLARLGSGWMIHVDAIRMPTQSYPARDLSSFPDPVSALIEEERRAHFERADGHFESKHALTLTYREPQVRKQEITRYLYSDHHSRHQTTADRTLEKFKSAIGEFEQYISNFIALERMRTRAVSERAGASPAQYDDLLQFARFCISGENHPVRLPDIPMYLDYLATAEFHHALTPMVDGRYIGVVSIDGFPAQSWPGILNSLDLMALSYRWSSRFIFLDPLEARQKLERTRKKWIQKVRPFMDQLFQSNAGALDQDAALMVSESEDAIASANSQLVAYGYYTPVVIVFDTDRSRLDVHCEQIRQQIQAEGFGARIEGLNATEAYLGSLPGNWYANVREPLIHTRNLADMLPFNAVWSGEGECPCPYYPPNSPPLTQLASGSTPFRLNLHVDDVGHTLVFGPTGSGKSTLLSLIAAQFRRYANAQIFAFDKGMSLYGLTAAVGGHHYALGSDEAPAFAPLSNLETGADRAWAVEWLETLIRLQGGIVDPDSRNAIHHHITLMTRSRHRSLSNFVSGVQKEAIKQALEPFTLDGPMGLMLDAENDGLELSAFQTFEIEELMNMGDRSLIPVLLYLFRRIEKSLDGRPSLIIIDEAWLVLGHGVFRDKIRDWLKVLRKANCAVVLATQSISDAADSGIMDVIKESCPTKICLPNGAARDSDSRRFYERLGLNERQIEIIATATPKQDYYVASPQGRRLFNMALGPVALAFVGASGKADIRQITALRAAHGEAWPTHWLHARGVSHAT